MQFAQLLEARYADKLGDGREYLGHVIGAARREWLRIPEPTVPATADESSFARRVPTISRTST